MEEGLCEGAMGEVVVFPPTEDERVPEQPHKRLRRCATVLGVVVALLGGATALFTAAVLFLGIAQGGSLLSLGPTSAYLGPAPDIPGIVSFGALPGRTRAAYAGTFLLEMTPVLFVLFNLRALLKHFAAGRLFGSENGRHVTRMAFGLAAYAFAPLLGHLVVVLAGHGVDQAWFHASEVHALVVSAVLLLLARIMDAGFEAEQDRGGFV